MFNIECGDASTHLSVNSRLRFHLGHVLKIGEW